MVIVGIMFELAVNGVPVKSHLYICLGRNTSNATNSMCKIARDGLEYYQDPKHTDTVMFSEQGETYIAENEVQVTANSSVTATEP